MSQSCEKCEFMKWYTVTYFIYIIYHDENTPKVKKNADFN